MLLWWGLWVLDASLLFNDSSVAQDSTSVEVSTAIVGILLFSNTDRLLWSGESRDCVDAEGDEQNLEFQTKFHLFSIYVREIQNFEFNVVQLTYFIMLIGWRSSRERSGAV